MAQLSQHVVYL